MCRIRPDGRIEPHHVEYVVQQLRTEVIPKLEQVSGRRYDEDRLREMLRALRAGRRRSRLGAGEREKRAVAHRCLLRRRVLHRAHLHRVSRHRAKASSTTACCAKRSKSASAQGLGPMTPDGTMEQERYRLVVEGPPNWTSFREFWKMFYDEGAVVVASSYTKVGGLYDRGFRHDPARPARDAWPSIAWAATPTSDCPRASSCSSATSASTTPTAS